MRVQIKWFMTGNVSLFEDNDAILGPQTTVWELKGLIQIRFGFPAKQIILISKHLLDNNKKLRNIGMVDQNAANDIVLTAHVVQEDKGLEKARPLEGAAAEEEEESDDGMQEFTHEDMILAMKMLGKQVPVSAERVAEVRENAPRIRPQFLNKSQDAPPPPPTTSNPQEEQKSSQTSPALSKPTGKPTVKDVFEQYLYGMRANNAEVEFQVKYPGVDEPYQYWDMRLPEDPKLQKHCGKNEFCVEMFFFGEIEKTTPEKFNTLVKQMLQSKGFKVRTPESPREAGCMYPLIGVAVVTNETELWELGTLLFEDFGQQTAMSSKPPQAGAAPAGAVGGCPAQ